MTQPRHARLPCGSLHHVQYDTANTCFRAEMQILDATGIHRIACSWRGPVTAGFRQIATGLARGPGMRRGN